MNADGIREIIRDVFGRGYRTEVINGWVAFRCPLAPWTHAKGSDSRASAGIAINDRGTSVFNCFTCGNKAPFQGLLRKYADFAGEDLSNLIEELEEESYLGPRSLPGWDEKDEESSAPMRPLDKALWLDLYESAENHPYVRGRGISPATARKLNLMIDPADPADGEERILFPVFMPNGDLVGLSGRATSKKAVLKVRDYHGLKKRQCLLGAHLITQERPKRILGVEGLFDYANAWECGQPAVAVMHSDITQQQADLLTDFGLPFYWFGDNDEAGRKALSTISNLLVPHIPCMKVRYPKVWIEDPSEPEGGHWLKDPGELLREEFEEMIRDCRLL